MNSRTPFAVLWDMDGVLVDTGEFHYQAWSETAGDLGIPFSYAIFHSTFGMTNDTILRMLLGADISTAQIETISDRKEAHFRQLIHGKAAALPGAAAWLAWFKEQGIPQAVASSAPAENIDFLIDELALRPYFQALVSAYGLAGKPDPAVFLAAARQLGAPPWRCLVIEDSLAGVSAARRAGMACLAVANTHPAADLGEAGKVVQRLDQYHPAQVAEWFPFPAPEDKHGSDSL